MAATLYIKSFATATLEGHDMSIGSSDTNIAVALSGAGLEMVQQLSPNEIWTVWDASVSRFNDFTVLAIVTSVDMDLELTTDLDGGTNTRIYTLGTRANIPFIIPKNRSYSGYVENFGGGTVDKIERLRVKNVDTNTASVRCVLFF